jgi:hypothetical protein
MQYSAAHVLVLVCLIALMVEASPMRTCLFAVLMCVSMYMFARLAALASTMRVIRAVIVVVFLAVAVLMAVIVIVIVAMATATGAVRVSVVAVAECQEQEDVEEDSDGCNDEHQAAVDGDWVEEALDGFQHESAGEDANDEDGDNSAHGLGAVISEGVAAGGALADEVGAVGGDNEGEDVGEHVGSVGHDRHTAHTLEC